jgi:hypothetical protein
VRIMITSKHVNSLAVCLTYILDGSVENYSQETGLDFLLGQALQVNAVLVP